MADEKHDAYTQAVAYINSIKDRLPELLEKKREPAGENKEQNNNYEERIKQLENNLQQLDAEKDKLTANAQKCRYYINTTKGGIGEIINDLQKLGYDFTQPKSIYEQISFIKEKCNDLASKYNQNMGLLQKYKDAIITKTESLGFVVPADVKQSKDLRTQLIFLLEKLKQTHESNTALSDQTKELSARILILESELDALRETNNRLKKVSEVKGDDEKSKLLQQNMEALGAKERELVLLRADLETKTNDLKGLEHRLNTLGKEVEKHENLSRTFQDDINELNRVVKDLRGELTNCQHEKGAVNQQLEAANQKIKETEANLMKSNTMLKRAADQLKNGVSKAENAAKAVIFGGDIFSYMTISTWLMLLVVILLILLFYIIYYCPKDNYNNINNNIDNNIKHINYDQEFIYGC
jgi:chromosome segregation ATPase